MIKHASEYVMRAERVLPEFGMLHPIGAELERARQDLIAAESQLVSAYRRWRDAMKAAAGDGSELAQRYVRESEWDLT